MLLMTLSFLLGLFQPVIAGPDRPGIAGGTTTTYRAGCYTVTVSYIKNNQQADGVTNDIVQVTVTDAGVLVDNIPVKFTVSGNSGSTTWNTGTSGYAAGTAQFFLNSQYTTPIPIKIEVPNDCNVAGESAVFTYIANPPNQNPPAGSTNPSYYTTIIQSAPANGSPTQVELHVTDGTNNLPQGTPVKFVITGGNPSAAMAAAVMGGIPGNSYSSTLPDASGTIDLTIKDLKAGDVIIQAFAWDAINSVWVSFGTQTVTFTVAPANPNPPAGSTNPSYYTTIIPSAIANGNDPTQVELHVTDGTNNLPQGTQVKFVITSTNLASGTASIMGGAPGSDYSSTLPDASGTIDVTIKDLNAGDVTIQAFVWDITTSQWISFGTQTVTFVLGPPVPGDPGGGGSGGNPPSGGGTDPPPGGGGGTPPDGGGGTPPGGGGTGPGVGGGTGSNNGYTVMFVTQDYQLADGTHQDSVYAYITTAQKQPVPGASVKFIIQNTPTSGTATANAKFVGQPDTTTNNNGLAAIGIVSTKAGTVYIDAILTVGGVSVLIDSSYRIVTFLDAPDVNNPLTNLSVIVYQALADGTQQTAVKAHIVGLDSTAMPDQEVIFTIDSGNAEIVTPQSVKTDGNGDQFIYFTSKKPGDVLITATVNGQSITFGSPAKVKFVPINIYVPPVFTPNGDGNNDVLKPILVGISTFHYFSVYNRWGNLIFTTQDPNNGWDGRFKGVAQPVETYLWIAEGIDVQGNKIVQKGMTTLVR